MKITNDPRDDGSLEYRRLIANEGCNICPICGEMEPFHIVDKNEYGIGNPKGIMSSLYSIHYTEGLFKIKHMAVDCYSCFTCGARWESEPYRVD